MSSARSRATGGTFGSPPSTSVRGGGHSPALGAAGRRKGSNPSSPRPTPLSPVPGSPKRASQSSHHQAGERGGVLDRDQEGGGSQQRLRQPSVRDADADRADAGIIHTQLLHTIEQLATLEATLWSILEGMKSNVTYVAFFCREYWGTSASKAQLSLEKFNWSDRLHSQVQQACVLESLSLAVASHFCSGTMQGVSVTIRSRLRNLLYYIHENCLVLLDLLRQRWHVESQHNFALPPDDPGLTAMDNLNFDILIRVNRYRQLRKGEHVMALRQHNEMIANVVRQLCRGGATKSVVPRSRGSGSGDRSPGIGGGLGRGVSRASAQAGVISVVSDILASSTPLDRMRPRAVRTNMLQHMRFQPLLSSGEDVDSPWPAQDPYERFGAERFSQEGPIIWFEPLPPMMADLERTPKLPPPASPTVYTLVLDLDETLVHYFEQDGVGSYGIRPGMFEFLQRMNQLDYEIVIFTAATQDYADWVIDQIDPDRLVHHRLYRQHALPWGPLFAKDLSRLGRDLDRTIIIDNVQENFMLQPNNGIFICTWYDDPQDCALFELTPLLEELIMTRSRVPDILGKYRDQIPTWAGFGEYCDLADSGLENQGLYGIQPGGSLGPPMTTQAKQGAYMEEPYFEPEGIQHQLQPPEPPPQAPLRAAPPPPAEPAARFIGGGSPYTQHGGYPQATMSATMPSAGGYPDPQATHLQPRAAHPPTYHQPQAAVRPAPSFNHAGLAGGFQTGPLQAPRPPPHGTRPPPASNGITGPYQAPMPQRADLQYHH